MAARITDAKKKKIIAYYVETENYRETARKFGVSVYIVRKICMDNEKIKQKITQKKEENTEDMIAYMESRKKKAQELIDGYLEALADKEKMKAAGIKDMATALGIIIDKFVNNPLKNEIDYAKLKIELIKFEKQEAGTPDGTEQKDNFLEALNTTAREVWEDEDKRNNRQDQ